ncbi:MAG: efflux RND transporter periplasmic adaptor subunit [Gemmataceae bacterium]
MQSRKMVLSLWAVLVVAQPTFGQLQKRVLADSSDGSKIATSVDGIVATVKVKTGDVVKKGQALIVLKSDQIELDVQIGKTTVEVAKAFVDLTSVRLEFATTKLERTKQLFQRGKASKEDFNTAFGQMREAKVELESSKTQLRQRELQLKLLELQLASHTIRAPFEGKVVGFFVREGEGVRALTPVLRLLKIRRGSD